MKSYSTIFFDFDGTIVDSGKGVFNSVLYSLEKMGKELNDKALLKKFIGPPLSYSYREYCGFDEKQTHQAIEYYREYYREKGINQVCVYDGIEKMLENIKKSGKKTVIATSKPEKFAVQILKSLDLAKYFDYIAGASMDEKSRNTKTEVLEYALKMANIDTPSSVLMVGDRFHDIEGAHNFGIDCVAVLYGYGNREEFLKYKAEYIVQTPEDVWDLVK